MNNIILKIDNREKDLVQILKTKNVPFINENLDIGDFLISDNENNILIIIERKKYADLSASIKDGRYKEQKERLIHSIPYKVRKIYLLEGNNMKDFQFPLKTFESVIINTMIRDGIFVFMSKNTDETVNFIENVMNNIQKYMDILVNEIVKNEEKVFENIHNCKKVKKDNITPEICYRNQLSQIPGISTKIGDVFVEKYKNMNNMYKELNNIGAKDDIIKHISNEKYGINLKKIGMKTAEKIYEYLF